MVTAADQSSVPWCFSSGSDGNIVSRSTKLRRKKVLRNGVERCSAAALAVKAPAGAVGCEWVLAEGGGSRG